MMRDFHIHRLRQAKGKRGVGWRLEGDRSSSLEIYIYEG